MAPTDEILELVGGVRLFSSLPKRSLKSIAHLARRIQHDAGHVIVREGTGAHALHVVVEGEAVVTVGGSEMKRLGPGDYVGEIALLDKGTRTATVTAVTPVTVLTIEGSEFLRVVGSDAAVAARLLAHLAGMVRSLDARLAE